MVVSVREVGLRCQRRTQFKETSRLLNALGTAPNLGFANDLVLSCSPWMWGMWLDRGFQL